MDPDDRTHQWLVRFGAELRAEAPQTVVCVSAHWATPRLRVSTRHGSALSRRVIEHLLHVRVEATTDDMAPLDAATEAALSLLFPDSVPVVQLSLHASCDPELHLTIGRGLEPLRSEGVLVVGSGNITHDVAERDRIRAAGETTEVLPESSRRFEAWVTDMVTNGAPYARSRGLARYRNHPDVRIVHVTDDSFLPLLVVAGAASSDRSPRNVGEMLHAGGQGGVSMAAYRFRL